MIKGNMSKQAQARSRRKRVIWLFVGLVGCAVSGLFVRWAADTRQSAVRAGIHAQLQTIAQAVRIFQQDSGKTPTVDDLVAAEMIDAAVFREFSRVQLEAGAVDALAAAPVIVQTVPCRAVRKGEAWGGPGETIDKDLSACRFVLMPDWSVVQIDEPDFQRDWAGKLRLMPLK